MNQRDECSEVTKEEPDRESEKAKLAWEVFVSMVTDACAVRTEEARFFYLTACAKASFEAVDAFQLEEALRKRR